MRTHLLRSIAFALGLGLTAAAATVIQLNVTVPGSGTPFNFYTDGTNDWTYTQLGPATTTVLSGQSASTFQVGSAAAHTLWSAYANSTASGYLMAFNTTSAPTNGTTITPGTSSGNMVECVGPSTQPSLTFGAGPPGSAYSAGIYLVFSTTGCNATNPTLSATATFNAKYSTP